MKTSIGNPLVLVLPKLPSDHRVGNPVRLGDVLVDLSAVTHDNDVVYVVNLVRPDMATVLGTGVLPLGQVLQVLGVNASSVGVLPADSVVRNEVGSLVLVLSEPRKSVRVEGKVVPYGFKRVVVAGVAYDTLEVVEQAVGASVVSLADALQVLGIGVDDVGLVAADVLRKAHVPPVRVHVQ